MVPADAAIVPQRRRAGHCRRFARSGGVQVRDRARQSASHAAGIQGDRLFAIVMVCETARSPDETIMTRKYPAVFAVPMILLLSACTPSWSVKLDTTATVENYRFSFVDARTDEQKKFRLVDFPKLTYQSYYGEANTTPPRGTLFAWKVNQSASERLKEASIILESFDILSDTSGSACGGCGLAAISYPAAIIASSGDKHSGDYFKCTVIASINGKRVQGESMSFYRTKATSVFRYNDPEERSALQKCLNGAIDQWLDSVVN